MSRRVRTIARVAGLSIVYFIAARIGLKIHAINGFASLVWPPSGIALAAVLRLGWGVWPGVAAGAFLANAVQGASPATALCIAAGNTLEALAGAAMLRRIPGFRPEMNRVRDVVWLMVGAAGLSTVISATIGVGTLRLAGTVPDGQFGLTWAAWWLGDAIGDLLFAPLLLTWGGRFRSAARTMLTPSAMVFLAAVTAACLLVFTGRDDSHVAPFMRPYFMFPLLIWGTLRFGTAGGVTGVLVTSVIAAVFGLMGVGPFARERLSDTLFALQAFMALIMATVLALGASRSEREEALRSLGAARDELEERVGKRTAELTLVNEELVHEIEERRRVEGTLLQREEALRSSEMRFRAVADTAIDGIVTARSDGIICYVNRAAERMFGWRAAEIVGQEINAVHPSWRSGSSRGPLDGLAVDGWLPTPVGTTEVMARRRDGSEFPAEVSVVPWTTDEGRFTSTIVRDLTERKQAQEALLRAYDSLEARIRDRTRELSRANADLKREIAERRQMERDLEGQSRRLAQSNAELEQFAYVASHDLQEPLRTVASYTQLLARRYQGKLEPDADQFIRYAVDAATWMHSLLDDLLAYSRVGRAELRMERTSAERVLEQALANLSYAVAQSRAVITHDPLPEVVGDGPQLVQLFQNLLGNALKFRGTRAPGIHVSAERAGSRWRFSIRDNGIGIEPRHLKRIFQVFQRLHTREEYPGTGIGLAICKKIVERHRGRIWAESRRVQGCTFMFTLPAATARGERPVATRRARGATPERQTAATGAANGMPAAVRRRAPGPRRRMATC